MNRILELRKEIDMLKEIEFLEGKERIIQKKIRRLQKRLNERR